MSYQPYQPRRPNPGPFVFLVVLACALAASAWWLWLLGLPGWVPLFLLLAAVAVVVPAVRRLWRP